MQAVLLPGTPPPAGHYAPAIVHQGLVYVSGQLPIAPGATQHTIGSIEDQTRQAMQNVSDLLRAAGSSLGRLLVVTIYISDIALWGSVNATYAQIMGAHRATRAIVPVGPLHFGYQIEIQAIAAVGSDA